MKRRKSPYLLISVLLVLVGAAAVMGVRGTAKPEGGMETPDGKITSENKEAPSASDVAKTVQGATGKASVPNRAVPASVGSTTSGPSIAVTTPVNQLPKPHPDPAGATSSQWYNR